MKRKRWRRYGLVAAALVVAAAAFWILNRPYPRLRKAVVAKLWDMQSKGLTLAEVENLMKAPPGDYSSGFRKWDTGSSGGSSNAAIYLEGRWGGPRIDPARSPDDMAKLQAKMNDWNYPRLSANAQSELRASMQKRQLYGWWGRNRVLVVEVDENSIVDWISFAHCENRPQGWLAGLVWDIDMWLEERN